MLLEVLSLLAELLLLLLARRDEQLFAHALVEVLFDDSWLRILGVSVVVILGKLCAVVSCSFAISKDVEVMAHLADLVVLIELLDHFLQSLSVALLADIDAVWIDSDNVAHGEVLELELAVLQALLLRTAL